MLLRRLSYWLPVFLACGTLQSFAQVVPRTSVEVPTRESADRFATEGKLRLKEQAGEIRSSMPDSLPAVGVGKMAKRDFLDTDSLGASYENGKLVLPRSHPSLDRVEELGKKAKTGVPALPDKDVLSPAIPEYKGKLNEGQILQQGQNEGEALKAIGQGQMQEHLKEFGSRADSVEQMVQKGEEFADQVEGLIANPQKIYSLQSLQELYDSLGISRLDSVLALASSKEEVTKEELLQALDLSFPSAPMQQMPAGPGDLAQLSEVKDLKDEVATPDLSSIKLSKPELADLPPIRGFQLPTDSIPLLDSLRELNSARQRLKLDQNEIDQNVTKVLIKRRPTLWNKMYAEGILSFLNEYDDFDLWQVSPAIGYRIQDNFSMGVGPNIQVSKEDGSWRFSTGYRVFAKYEIMRQHAYLQLEDVVVPVTPNREYLNNIQHSILAGGGYLLSVSKVLAINFCLLYRVNRVEYSEGERSPWVIRIGLSSKNSKGVK